MKIKNIIISSMVMATAVLTLGSCNDFLTIYPTDKTIGPDFWKTKADVQEMVSGAYQAMAAGGIQERAIVWGSFRSDELEKTNGYSNHDLENISAANLLPSNGLNSWGDFYGVINRCNIVLNHVNGVMESDPQFTQGDCDEVCAQMKALRSLCYFYLVRAFRDVPYTKKSYESDEDVEALPQMAPDSVLQYCIEDLQWAEHYILKTGAYGRNDSRNWGYFTRDAVWALLSDIYLWRAAMTHSQSDYDMCIQYADKVINSKDAYYRQYHNDRVTGVDKEDKFHLIEGWRAFGSIFASGESDESILEWLYDGEYISNTKLENYYLKIAENNTTCMVQGTSIFQKTGNAASQYAYLNTHDYRFWDNACLVNSSTALQFPVRKYANRSSISYYEQRTTLPTEGATKLSGIGDYNKYAQNWIVYRLTDVMLMKAEAMVATAASDSDEVKLRGAYELVKAVNKRSWIEPRNRFSTDDMTADSLTYGTNKGKANMERLVMAERLRELCFEGKRWFDLVRYSYRHMEGVDIHRTLASQTTWPRIHDDMMKLVVRKYESGGQAVIYKLKTEPYLYFPILLSETKVNPNLIQNPVYEEEETISKN